MKMHFYDLLYAGKSPAEGQVVRYHSALFCDTGDPIEKSLAVKLRDDVCVSPHNIDASPLALLDLGSGLNEVDFARAIAAVFEQAETLHVGISNTSRLDAYIRHAIYRSLIPARCVGLDASSRYLDIETLYRAISILRPEEVPQGFTGSINVINSEFQAAMWDLDWQQDNRALRVKELLAKAMERSPKLVDHCFKHSSIAAIKSSFGMDDGEVSDLAAVKPALVVHQSILSPSGFSLLLPLATDITYPDIAYMADLACDLSALADEDTRSLESLVRKNKGDGLPIVRVSLSRIPFVAPLKVIRPEDAKRLRINGDLVKSNIQMLRNASHLTSRLRDEPILELNPLPADVDHRMWAGEFSASDLQIMRMLHDQDFEDWIDTAGKANDRRVKELATRVVAREHASILTHDQLSAWRAHLNSRMCSMTPSSLAELRQQFQNASSEYPSALGISFLLKRLEGIAVHR